MAAYTPAMRITVDTRKLREVLDETLAEFKRVGFISPCPKCPVVRKHRPTMAECFQCFGRKGR